jgi:hypothetical protein
MGLQGFTNVEYFPSTSNPLCSTIAISVILLPPTCPPVVSISTIANICGVFTTLFLKLHNLVYLYSVIILSYPQININIELVNKKIGFMPRQDVSKVDRAVKNVLFIIMIYAAIAIASYLHFKG